MSRRESIWNAPLAAWIGLMWIGYAGGRVVSGQWLVAALFFVAGVLFILWGEGVRLTFKRAPGKAEHRL